jgi:tetratricopeptide (TPR) repeat protein
MHKKFFSIINNKLAKAMVCSGLFAACNNNESFNYGKHKDAIEAIKSKDQSEELKDILIKIKDEVGFGEEMKSDEYYADYISDFKLLYKKFEELKFKPAGGFTKRIEIDIKWKKKRDEYLDVLSDITYKLGLYGITINCCDILLQSKDISEEERAKFYMSSANSSRRLGAYEDSIKKYKKILEESKQRKLVVAGIQNNMGLSYTEIANSLMYNDEGYHARAKNYELAKQCFQEAKRLNSKDPLYSCGLASALFNLKDLKGAIQEFEQAASLLTEWEDKEDKLTIENKKAITTKLINVCAYLNKIVKENEAIGEDVDDIFISIANNYIAQYDDLNIASLNFDEKEDKKIKTIYTTIKDIQKGDQDLYKYYKSFVRAFNVAHTTAEAIKGEAFVLDQENLLVSGASKLIALVPLVGHTLSEVIEKAYHLKHKVDVKKYANNICELAESKLILDEIVCGVILEIFKNGEEIKALNPNIVLPFWMQKLKLSGLVQWVKEKKEELEEKLYGENNTEDIQKLAHKHATDILSDYISSKKIFEEFISINPGQKPASATPEDKIALIVKFFEKMILEKDKSLKGNHIQDRIKDMDYEKEEKMIAVELVRHDEKEHPGNKIEPFKAPQKPSKEKSIKQEGEDSSCKCALI